MSAMDKMLENVVRTLLTSLEIDPEKLKEEVGGRIREFEHNIRVLNETLIALHKSNARIERNLARLMQEQGVPYEWNDPAANDQTEKIEHVN